MIALAATIVLVYLLIMYVILPLLALLIWAITGERAPSTKASSTVYVEPDRARKARIAAKGGRYYVPPPRQRK